MRRGAQIVLLVCLAAGLALAQGSEGESGSTQLWKWANFVLFAGGLGYLAAKLLPPVLASRAQAISKDIAESLAIRNDAETRAAQVERRLAGLEAEIAALRAESQRESQAETERLAAHTAAEIAKIQAQSEREIGDAAKAARTELKRYAARLAVDLAERKIRARMTPVIEDGLVRVFVRDLK